MTVISFQTKQPVGQAYSSREEAAADAMAELKALRSGTDDAKATQRLAKIYGIIKALRDTHTPTVEHADGFLETLARLVSALRPSWGIAGVRAALKGCDAEPYDIALAAIRAAREKSNRTPAIIPQGGPHWQAARKRAKPLPERLAGVVDEHRMTDEEKALNKERLLAARAACSICDERGRLVDGRFCSHDLEGL